jgi:nucleoside-diphosphate-sugar epimerase/glycosyltransferase involved in cell wall biosynthesis
VAEVSAALTEAIRELRGPIVVFGAGGFIGANLIRTLLAVREDCYAVTHQGYVPWRLVELPARHVLHADLTDPASLTPLFECHPFKTIFNLAAFGTRARQQDADLIYQTNFIGLMNLVEIASVNGFAALVHAGSSSEYGLNCRAPREDAQVVPNSHYAVSKVSSAYLLRYYGVVKKLPVINLRLYSVYGPFQEPDGLIPTLLCQGTKGSYQQLVEADISRDFVYVDDAVEATVAGAAQGVQRLPGGSINIASGTKTTLKDAVRTVQAICEIKEQPVWGSMPSRAGELEDRYGDPALAQEILGWKARTSLEEGLRRTLAWQSSDRDVRLVHNMAAHGAPLRLSAVIACYKDAQAIPLMHKRLTEVFSSLGVDYEIIFVNDGSPDDTDAVLGGLTATDNHVLAIEHSRNFGSQNAFVSGMQLATGDAVVLLDGDLQDPPEVIAAFYDKWRQGNDVVYGRRARRETSTLLAIGCKTFYRVFRTLSYVPVPLDAGDFSLMDRKVVNELLSLPETDQFLRGLRSWVGFRQTGVDYVRPARAFGRSTHSWLKNIWWAKKGIFSFSFVPLELLSYAGATLAVLSFLALIYEIIDRLRRPEIPHGVSTIIVVILLFGSVNLLAISILGEYLIKIFEEAKRRPKFIRKAVRQGGKHFNTAAEIETLLWRRSRKTAAQRSLCARSFEGCER